MACSLSYLPAIASTCTTPISARNGASGPWKLGCTRSSINVVTFFPVGKRLQSNVGWSSSSHQRLTNALVVRAEGGKENVAGDIDVEVPKSENVADKKQRTEVSPFGPVDAWAELNNGVLKLTIPKTDNREMDKISAEFKNGVLNITIPISKVVVLRIFLLTEREGFNYRERALVTTKMGIMLSLQFGLISYSISVSM